MTARKPDLHTPEPWREVPLWTLFTRVKRTGFENEELLSVYREHGVVIKSSRDDNNNNASEDLSTYQLVEPGDLAINKMKAWQGSVAISNLRGIVSPAYFIFRSTHSENGRFLHYLFRSSPYVAMYARDSKGVRPNQWDLDPQRHSRLSVPLPPVVEQRQIADYLDAQTAKIDTLIVKQERLIETLAERRQAVISRAVTKGLDPNVPMKDSGLEWMGMIPKGWAVDKLSRHFAARKGAIAGLLTGEYCASIPGVFPVYSGQTENDGVMAWIESFEFDAGAEGVLFSTTVGAKAMTVQHIVGRFSLSQNCMIIQPREKLSVRFFFYFFQMLFAVQRRELSGHMQASFRMADLYSYRLLIPSAADQEHVAQFLDKTTSRIDALAAKARDMIDVLKERRQALISAAVTGKIDVRGLV